MDNGLAAWVKAVKIEMVQRDLNVSELAEAIGKTKAHTASVINGKLIAPNTASAISNYLGIEDAPYENIRRAMAPWTKAVKIALIERDWSVDDLARAIGKSRKFTYDVMRGYMIYPDTAKLISDALGIEEAPYSCW